MSINAISFARNAKSDISSKEAANSVSIDKILACMEDPDSVEFIGKAQEGFKEIADTVLSNEKLRGIVGVPVKIATVLGLGALGFFTGKLFFANPVTKKVIGFVAKVPQKMGFDASGAINKGFDKIYDLGVGLKKKIFSIPVKRKREFISDYIPLAKRKLAELTEKWFKNGVNVDKVKELAKASTVKGRAPVTTAVRRAFVQNGLLKTAGAALGIYKGVDFAKDALDTDVENIPALLKKYANPAAATLIAGEA
ncbi:MAG: hypothetical protein PHX18_08865 [Candidatus Gastranaerophilales bacterium]|nr:hypothetical protein [Candidatus Gastranaerophilales bacterium]